MRPLFRIAPAAFAGVIAFGITARPSLAQFADIEVTPGPRPTATDSQTAKAFCYNRFSNDEEEFVRCVKGNGASVTWVTPPTARRFGNVLVTPAPGKGQAFFQKEAQECSSRAKDQLDFAQCMGGVNNMIGRNFVEFVDRSLDNGKLAMPGRSEATATSALPDARRPAPSQGPPSSAPSSSAATAPSTSLSPSDRATLDRLIAGQGSSPSSGAQAPQVSTTQNTAVAATSAVETYACPRSNGNVTITIDRRNKTVRDSTRLSIYTCTVTSIDGITGPITTASECNIPIVGEISAKVTAQQRVVFEGNTVTYGGILVDYPIQTTDAEKRQFNRLNMRTGLLENWDGSTDQCNLKPEP